MTVREAGAVARAAEPGDGQVGLTGLLAEYGVDGSSRGRSERLLRGMWRETERRNRRRQLGAAAAACYSRCC